MPNWWTSHQLLLQCVVPLVYIKRDSSFSITKAYVRVGSTDSNSGGTQYTSLALIQHPRYDARTSDYDVGVIILTKQIQIDNTNTKIVKLAKSGSDVPDGSNLTVSGWGTTTVSIIGDVNKGT